MIFTNAHSQTLYRNVTDDEKSTVHIISFVSFDAHLYLQSDGDECVHIDWRMTENREESAQARLMHFFFSVVRMYVM